MSKTLKIYLVLFVVLIAVMVLIDQMRVKPLNWEPSYRTEGKNPLDLYVLNHEIESLLGDSVVRYSLNPYEYFRQKDTLTHKNETYLFISDYAYIDDYTNNKIMNAVLQGSTLFIVSDGFPPSLTDSLQTGCYYVPLNYAKAQVAGVYTMPEVLLRFSKEGWSGNTYPYSPVFGQYAFTRIDTTSSTALGYMKLQDRTEFINFLEIRFGRGKILLHNQPVIFSNYSLLTGYLQQEYAERVFSFLPDQPVVWFQASKKNEQESEKNILSIIFKYPPLRMTWLIFIYGMILFILFTAKRKQRVVPIIKPLQNTTVEFAQTIGNLYYQEGDISDIAHKKIIYFLDRVRQTYNVDTHLDDEKLMLRLHLKSGKEKELISEILTLIRDINRLNYCDKQKLIQLSTLIDRFWEPSTPNLTSKK